MSSYQIDFTCSHIGRCIPASKRIIAWKIGCRNGVSSITDFKEYKLHDEIHSIQVFWSKTSGKKRIIWNKKDISSLVCPSLQQKDPRSDIDVSWKGRTGIVFRIICFSKSTPPGLRQYNLYINGTDYFSLPSKADLSDEAKPSPPPHSNPVSDSAEKEKFNVEAYCAEISNENHADEQNGSLIELQQQHTSRLQSAGYGFCGGLNCLTFSDDMDELRSDLYTSTVDGLRFKMAESVPAIEEMMSRAIIDAFSEDHHELSDLSISPTANPAEVEVECLRNTFQWIAKNQDGLNSPDFENSRRAFMQNVVNNMVSHVRHDRLTVSDSSQIMLCVASVIGLKIQGFIPKDKLILSNLGNHVTEEDIKSHLLAFGDIKTVAVAKTGGFGICQFSSLISVDLAMSAAHCGNLTIHNTTPNAHYLEPPSSFLISKAQVNNYTYRSKSSSDSPSSVTYFPYEYESSFPDCSPEMDPPLEI